MHILLIPSFYRTTREPLRGLFFREQARALAECGAQVGVIYYDERDTHKLSVSGLSDNHFQIKTETSDGIFELTQSGWSTSPRTILGLKAWLWLGERLFKKYVQRRGMPEVLHAHNGLYGGLLAMMIGKKYGIPYYITEHSSAFLQNKFSPFQKAIIRDVLGSARQVFAVSKALSVAMRDVAPKVKISVMANFVETDFFKREHRKAVGSEFRLLSVGNLNANKGFDVLIRAFGKAFPQDRDVKLIIGGRGELAGELQQLIDSQGLSDNITLTGLLSREQVAEGLSGSDAFVLASRYETFGVVFVEALAAGVPIIATKCGGPQEFLNDTNAILVDPDNVEQLAQALTQMRSNHSQYNVAELQKYARENFDSHLMAEKLIAAYLQNKK